MTWASGRHWLDSDHPTDNHHFPILSYFSYIFVRFWDIFVKVEYTQSQRWQCTSLRFMACLGIDSSLDSDHSTNNHHFPNLLYCNYIFVIFWNKVVEDNEYCSQHKDEYHCGLWLGHLGATDSDWDHSTNEQPGLGLSLLRSFTCYTPQFPWGWVCSCFCLYPSSSSSNIHLVHSTWGHLSFCICTICVFVFCVLFVYVVVLAFIKANSH